MVQFKPKMTEPKARILIVDDSSFARDILKGMLTEAGFSHLLEADNPDEALSLLRTKEPDLVLLDIDLGGAFDGVGVLKEIKRISAKTRVIMISALAQKMLEEKIIADSADAFLIKPFKSEQLLFAIGLALGYDV